MNETKLRETIRKEIRKSLKEVDVTKGVEQGAAQLDKQPGVKMLKRALGQGSPRQQAAGLLKVINAISGGSSAVKMALIQMLKLLFSLLLLQIMQIDLYKRFLLSTFKIHIVDVFVPVLVLLSV